MVGRAPLSADRAAIRHAPVYTRTAARTKLPARRDGRVGCVARFAAPRRFRYKRSMHTALDRVLEPFRPGFAADGFEVSVRDMIDGIVILKIVHKPEACEECLLPDDMLGPMLTTAFRDVAPDVTAVRIEHVQS